MNRLSASQVVNLILPVFRDYGYDGASLTALAGACGLSRGSLYHHFPGGKQEMARAALTRSGASMARLIMAPLNRGGIASQKIEDMFEGVKNYYTGDPPVCLMNSLTLGSGRDLFGAEVASAVNAWAKSLARVIAEQSISDKTATVRSLATIERIQGCLIIARVSGNKAAFDENMDALAKELVQG